MRARFMRFFGLAAVVALSAMITLTGCSSNTASAPQSSAASNSPTNQESETGASAGSAERRAANEKTAVEFMYAFYNDWDFQEGNATYSAEAFNRRSLPYIAEGTVLHDELSKDNSFGMGSDSRFIRTAALHAADVKPTMYTDDVCVVDVSYCGTQNNVTQEWYDNMMERLSSATWTLVFDEKGMITAMEEGDAADKYAFS